MSDNQLQLACIDLETNGLDMADDILAISVRILEQDGTPTDTEYYSLIRSEQPLNKEAHAVNRLTEEERRSAPTKEDVLLGLKDWWLKNNYGMQFAPIGHNFLGFDKPRLEKLMGEANYRAMFHYHADDTMVIARSLQRSGVLPVKSCSLVLIAEFFKIEYENKHNASGDTYVCGHVYNRLLRIQKPDFKTRLYRVFKPGYLGVVHA